jgi:hypothetical protein
MSLQTYKTEEELSVPYNPDTLISYKVIHGYSDPEYTIDKVRNIEWELHNARQASKHNAVLQDKINGLDEHIMEWSNPNYDKDDVLRELCEYFGINPSKEIEFTATFTVTGTVSVPFDEVEDFDIDWVMQDEISIESSNGNVEIHDWSLDSARASS